MFDGKIFSTIKRIPMKSYANQRKASYRLKFLCKRTTKIMSKKNKNIKNNKCFAKNGSLKKYVMSIKQAF